LYIFDGGHDQEEVASSTNNPPPWVVNFIANGYGLMELMQGMNALILKRE
jgi:hypothetical protein